jgi:hypothetical protein
VVTKFELREEVRRRILAVVNERQHTTEAEIWRADAPNYLPWEMMVEEIKTLDRQKKLRREVVAPGHILIHSLTASPAASATEAAADQPAPPEQNPVMSDLAVEPATKPPVFPPSDQASEPPAAAAAAPEAAAARPLNSYELRQQRRQERYRELAGKAQREGDASNAAADRIASFIPLGQPILVGHHSEGRHRRDLKRIRRKTAQAIESWEKSEYYSRRAASVGSGGISSDDPDAIAKLKAKLAELEATHAAMKAANKKARGTYPAYALQNSNANLRRVRERIAHLEKAATRETKVIKLDGLTIRHDAEENRVMLLFDQKPTPAILALCKKHGFKWSPSRQANVRFFSNAAIYAAEVISQAFAAQQGEGRGEQGTE